MLFPCQYGNVKAKKAATRRYEQYGEEAFAARINLFLVPRQLFSEPRMPIDSG
jgi:hypothetical protein